MSDHYTVTPDVLSNMGSLDKLLTERGYTTATVPMDGERVVRNEVGATDAAIRDPEVDASRGAVAPPQDPGATPQPVAPQQPTPQPQQPQISPEQYQAAMVYAERMRQQAEQAAQRQREAEDQRFLDSIAHLPQMEQDREILIRYNRDLEAQLQGAHERVQTVVQSVEEREQEEAKGAVAFNLAMTNGLHWENPAVRDLLLSAETGQQMRQTAAYLAQMTPREQAQVAQQAQPPPQTPAQVAAQTLVAAPGRGSGTRAPQVRKHSGDLAGYIKTKSYQLVGND